MDWDKHERWDLDNQLLEAEMIRHNAEGNPDFAYLRSLQVTKSNVMARMAEFPSAL